MNKRFYFFYFVYFHFNEEETGLFKRKERNQDEEKIEDEILKDVTSSSCVLLSCFHQ